MVVICQPAGLMWGKDRTTVKKVLRLMLIGWELPPLDDDIFDFLEKENNEEYAYVWTVNNEWKCLICTHSMIQNWSCWNFSGELGWWIYLKIFHINHLDYTHEVTLIQTQHSLFGVAIIINSITKRCCKNYLGIHDTKKLPRKSINSKKVGAGWHPTQDPIPSTINLSPLVVLSWLIKLRCTISSIEHVENFKERMEELVDKEQFDDSHAFGESSGRYWRTTNGSSLNIFPKL